jgi:hypothetical protein
MVTFYFKFIFTLLDYLESQADIITSIGLLESLAAQIKNTTSAKPHRFASQQIALLFVCS